MFLKVLSESGVQSSPMDEDAYIPPHFQKFKRISKVSKKLTVRNFEVKYYRTSTPDSSQELQERRPK